MAQFEIGKKINTFYDVYDLGQHTLSKANEEKVYDLLVKDPNATIENGILTLKANVYDFYAEHSIMEGFSNYVETFNTPEEILSKESFVNYFNENELDDVLEDFAQHYAISKATSIVNQLDLSGTNVSKSEVLKYLVDSEDIQINVEFDAAHFYDVYLGHTNTNQPLSYAQSKAVDVYLEQNNFIEDGLVTIHHDADDEIFASVINLYSPDESLEENLSLDDDFMSYVVDCYKKQIGDLIIRDLGLDQEAVYDYVTGIYDSNDNLREAAEIIRNKTIETPYRTSEGEYLVFHGSETAWETYDSSKAPEDRLPTYANENHIYFSSNQLTAGTYCKRTIVKDKPPDVILIKPVRNDMGDIYFAEADKYGNFTGRGLKPKEIHTNEFGTYATDIKNNEWITIPSFDKNNVPQLQKEGEFTIFEIKPDGKINLDERFKYFTANYTGKLGLGINKLVDHVDFNVLQEMPSRIETVGVVRPFYVKLNNPFIVDANGGNSVVPFVDNYGREWGESGSIK